MDTGVFPIDFQVDHRFWCTRTGRNVLFQRHLSNDRARSEHAFGVPFTQGIPRFCRTMLALGSPCKARGAQEYAAPNGGSLDAHSAKIGARRHLSMRARLASTSTPRGDAREEPRQDDFKGASR